MADRRMFSARITNSARFLRMPVSSRLLYYDLGMTADDDGVVEAFSVMAATGATEDDLRVLCSKGFVTVLNDDLVTYINDWNENNRLRADRKVDSIYKDLLLQIVPEAELLQSRERADTGKSTARHAKNGRPVDVQWTSNGQPMDNQWTAQDRIGKDSGSKEKDPLSGVEKESSPRFLPPTPQQVQEYLDEKEIRSFTGESFCDFYASKGWMVGRNRMKDWRAAVRTWIRQDESRGIDPHQDKAGQTFAGRHVVKAPVVQRDVDDQYAGDVPEEAR